MVAALEQQYDAFARAEESGSSLLAGGPAAARPARRSASSSSSSWPASKDPTTATARTDG